MGTLLRKSPVIQHDPNPLFDILGYLLALAIHDDIFATGLRDVEQVYRIEIPSHMNDVKLEVKRANLDLPVFHQPGRSASEYRASTTMGLLGHHSDPDARYPSASDFVTDNKHVSFSNASGPAKGPNYNGSKLSALRNWRQSLSYQFNFCDDCKPSILSYYYLQNVTSTTSSHVEEDQEAASLEVWAHDTLQHLRTENGKLEGLEQQIRKLENQMGEILELVKLWKEGKEKIGQTSRDSRVKKRAAPPSGVGKSDRLKSRRL